MNKLIEVCLNEINQIKERLSRLEKSYDEIEYFHKSYQISEEMIELRIRLVRLERLLENLKKDKKNEPKKTKTKS